MFLNWLLAEIENNAMCNLILYSLGIDKRVHLLDDSKEFLCVF